MLVYINIKLKMAKFRYSHKLVLWFLTNLHFLAENVLCFCSHWVFHVSCEGHKNNFIYRVRISDSDGHCRAKWIWWSTGARQDIHSGVLAMSIYSPPHVLIFLAQNSAVLVTKGAPGSPLSKMPHIWGRYRARIFQKRGPNMGQFWNLFLK